MKDAMKALADRIAKTKDVVLTEEATKNAYIMPFLQALGYDVFNPLEVVPEFVADVGIKEGERVDYAIVLNGQPVILIECKACAHELDVNHESQLLRYFHASKARFGILTNGITYKFFTDLAEPNKMDLTAFLTIDISDPERINYAELMKFKKECFDAENIRKTADILKTTSSIRAVLNAEFSAPSEDFVRMIFKKIEPLKLFNQTQKEKTTPLVKAAIDAMISEKVKANLDAALKTTADAQQEAAAAIHETVVGPETGIVTTPEEIEAFHIIKAIGAELVPAEKITMRDAKSYCAILFEDNNRKPICRLFFNNLEKKALVFFDAALEEKIFINEVSEIYQYKDRLTATIQKYATDGQDQKPS